VEKAVAVVFECLDHQASHKIEIDKIGHPTTQNSEQALLISKFRDQIRLDYLFAVALRIQMLATPQA
jgi:hypothetical protein